MRFLYVDRIYDFRPSQSIRGLKFINPEDELFYRLPDGQSYVSPAIVSESLAQLGSWLLAKSHDFSVRPVYLSDDFSQFRWLAKPGDCIELKIDLIHADEDVWTGMGTASVNGTIIAHSPCSRTYLLPAEDFDTPEAMARQYENLLSKPPVGLQFPSHRPDRPLAMRPLQLVDAILEHKPFQSITTLKNFASNETYFMTHFRRKPVVPGVLLMSVFGESCQYLIRPDLQRYTRRTGLYPLYVENVRFRKFVTPGDQLVTKLEVCAGDPAIHGSICVVRGQMFAGQQRVWQGKMGFRVISERGYDPSWLTSFSRECPDA